MPLENLEELVAVNPSFAPSTSPSLGNLGTKPMMPGMPGYRLTRTQRVRVPRRVMTKGPESLRRYGRYGRRRTTRPWMTRPPSPKRGLRGRFRWDPIRRRWIFIKGRIGRPVGPRSQAVMNLAIEYQRDRNKYYKSIWPRRGPRYMDFRTWKRRRRVQARRDELAITRPMPVMRPISPQPMVTAPPPPDVLAQTLKKLPLLEQARIQTEMKANPRMVPVIMALLKAANPMKAIIQDRNKVMANIIKPTLFPQQRGKWGVFRRYAAPAIRTVIAREAKKRKAHRQSLIQRLRPQAGMIPKGMGEDDDYPYEYPGIFGWDRSKEYPVMDAADMNGLSDLGDIWSDLAKAVMPMVKEYGVPILKKNLDVVTKKKRPKKPAEKPPAQVKAEEKKEEQRVVQAAQDQAAAAAHKADPKTQPEPKKKKMGTGLKIGIGVGAVAAAATLGLIIYKIAT